MFRVRMMIAMTASFLLRAQHKKQPSECIRVEIISLSLKPGSRVAEDSGIVRLFVEYCFLGLPSVDTPLSLKKPLPEHSISYNFSNVVDVQDSSEVIGHLVVTVEALEAPTSIMKDPERDRPLTTLA